MYDKNNHRMEKEIKIAVVIKTEGLEYDDRVRKEILTIEKLFPYIKFKIFAMLPDNKELEGVTEYGIPYKTVYIPSRDKFPSAKRVFLKAYQFYKVVKEYLDEFDAVWAANVDTSLIPMLYKCRRMVWDLHELPMRYLSNPLKKRILRFIFNKCRIVIHANPQREQYLESLGVVTNPKKHYALRNFPNFDDIDQEYDERFFCFKEWKGNRRCVYLQGLDGDRRAAYESVKAVLRTEDMIAVVVGRFDEKSKSHLELEFGNELGERVMFMGRIPQLKIPQYVRLCYTTLVFYKNTSPNNYYCEANRFYQSVLMGLPVVVGNNPPMRDLVEQYGFGISIDDDGCDVQRIVEGISNVVSRYDEYKRNIEKYKGYLLWNNQEAYIKQMIEALFD